MTRRIRTRGYELDRSGRIGVAQIARYLEHLRWESLGDPAVGLGRLFSDGNHMVVRAQTVDLLASLHHDTDLVATLDVTRVGRSSLDIGHRVYRAADDIDVARGGITGVFIDGAGTPLRIPDEVRVLAPAAATAPDHDHDHDDDYGRSFESTFVVRPSDTDLLQHVNHARYIDYFDDARTEAAHAGALGLDPSAATLAIAHLEISYDTQAVAGDKLTVRLWPSPDSPHTLIGSLIRASDNRTLTRARLVITHR